MTDVTEAMVEAGVDAWLAAGGHHCDSADLVGPIYLAMDAASTPADVGKVERVAMAICAARYGPLEQGSWAKLSGDGRDHCRHEARAAIAALAATVSDTGDRQK